MRGVVLTGLLLSLSAPIAAQERVQGVECGGEREVPEGALTEITYNRLTEIHQDIDEGLYDKALEGLDALLERRPDDYARVSIYQAKGHIHSELENYDEAIEYFNRTIELDRLPNEQHFNVVRQVAHLHYAREDYRSALAQLDLWFCMVPDEATDVTDVWVMKAGIHARIEEHRNALQAIDTAIAIADEPREQWYQLKLGMHLELAEFHEAAEALRILVRMRPDRKSYWLQLASVLTELGNERDARAVLALAYQNGLLNRESEYKQLAGMLQQQRVPRRAAEIMEEGLDEGIIGNTRQNWEMVAGAWYEARELDRALDAYELAGALASDGKPDLQRGFILVDLERWEYAEEALTRALELGGLSQSQIGNAYLLIGTSRYHQGHYNAALEAFNQAANYGRVEDAAREWINHVQEERSRREES